jgi:mRNA interferase RelE/StbE
LAWTVEVSPKALKALSKLDKPIAQSIVKELQEIEELDNPRLRGRALAGNLRGLWRYRVGDYRIVCDILDSKLIVLVINAAHRSKIH